MDWRVAQAIVAMERHLERPLSVAELARRHGASPRKIRARARSPGRRLLGATERLSSRFGLRTGETAHTRFADAAVVNSIL